MQSRKEDKIGVDEGEQKAFFTKRKGVYESR
jgi:hypothetical protein